MSSMIDPLYPVPDPEREDRMVSDVIQLMKLRDDDAIKAIVKRWLKFTLVKAQRFNRLPWWFARRYFACVVYEGQDVFDLQGELDRIIAVFCPEKLSIRPIDYIIEERANAYSHHRSNCGDPVYYALHSGRLHLWPAPDKPMMLSVTYSRLLTAEIIPPEWEAYLVDGIIGLYGRHFDSSGLLEEADQFTPRFWEGIKSSRAEHFDSMAYERMDRSFAKTRHLSSSEAYAEISTTEFDDAILKPAYDEAPGMLQILADLDEMARNQRGVPFAQIKGERQP